MATGGRRRRGDKRWSPSGKRGSWGGNVGSRAAAGRWPARRRCVYLRAGRMVPASSESRKSDWLALAQRMQVCLLASLFQTDHKKHAIGCMNVRLQQAN